MVYESVEGRGNGLGKCSGYRKSLGRIEGRGNGLGKGRGEGEWFRKV